MRGCIVPGCSAEVREDRWICRRCFDIYGYYSQWPDWLRELLVIEQRERRYEKKIGKNNAVHIEFNEEIAPDNYPPELGIVYSRFHSDIESGLPLYPYDDEELNAIYRKTNRITAPNEKLPLDRTEYQRQRYSLYGDKINAASREWQRRNKEYYKEKSRRYLKSHPWMTRLIYLRRRARESATEHTLTREQELEILSWGCLVCGTHENITLAHDIAVSKGGGTTWDNCFCLCQSHNSQQYTKSLAEWRPDLVEKLEIIRKNAEEVDCTTD